MRQHGRGREKKSDGEEDKGTGEEEVTGRENQDDVDIIAPAAYHTQHFHPVISSVLMS